jgi:hypothetical protein
MYPGVDEIYPGGVKGMLRVDEMYQRVDEM